jgi:hypothetical protein
VLLMVDSGGGLRLRLLAFAIILVFAARGMYINKHIKRDFLIIYSVFLLSLIPPVLNALANGVSIASILVWLMSFLLIPFFYFYVKGGQLKQENFVTAGAIFSTIVIVLFFGRVLNIGPIVTVNDYLSTHSDGFFGYKNFLSGDVLPNVYFQGTLSLIICGALALKKKTYWRFLLVLIAMILAPSRFGFLVLSLWAGFLFFRKSWSRILVLPLIAIVTLLILDNLAFGKELFSVFSGESDAIDIRNGHMLSIFRVFEDNPQYFFFGQGPGTVFFSTGFAAFTDNIEISQLEYVRKYGILSFLCFCLMYFYPVLHPDKSKIFLKGALILYFVVSISNPVLFSIFSMLFLTFSYLEMFDLNTKNPL